MKKLLTALLLGSLFCQTAFAQAVFGPYPSTVGVSAPGQVPGTQTNDSATAGNSGEYLTNNLVSGSAIALTTGTAATVISQATGSGGDFDASGVVCYAGNAATSVTQLITSLTTVTNTIGTLGDMNREQDTYAAFTPFAVDQVCHFVGPWRVSVATNTPVFLTAYAVFSVNTASAYGRIRLRRVR
jgi:hypothetical protein